ncbi:RidA family protein [Nocardioides salarius]|uniref:RidA family protein n=1 Tax=Nocardioides salarius TaxID=374513 RepID=UPI0030F811DE
MSSKPHLPPPPRPQGSYRPAMAAGGLLVTAGMTPRVDGALQYVGQVGAEIGLEEARAAAAIAAGNAVSALAEVVGSADGIGQVLRMTVYVNAATGFTQHSAVADGASARLVELLGERGSAVRSAVGVSSLPGGACVEIELTGSS